MKKNTSAGALLFATITAFIIGLVGSTIVILTMNQYTIIDDEVDRTIAYYRAQAGMENAIYWAYTNPGALPSTNGSIVNLTGSNNSLSGSGVNITITKINGSNPAPFQNLSTYGIRVTTQY